MMQWQVAPPIDLPLSQTDNPYWDTIRAIPGSQFEWEYEQRYAPDAMALFSKQRIDRNDLCGKYAWAIPDPASLDFVAEWLKPAAIEIGAGTGYWAWQLSQLGVDMIAYDLFPPQHTGQNHYHSPRNGEKNGLLGVTREVYFDVRAGGELIAAQYPDRTLFLCWPPYDSDMAVNTLNAYQGKRLVFIGEGDGGCTADDAFFEKLGEEWEEVASHRPIQWNYIHDYITVYEQK